VNAPDRLAGFLPESCEWDPNNSPVGIAMIAAAGAGIVIWTAVKVGAHSERRHRERKGEISRRRPEPLA